MPIEKLVVSLFCSAASCEDGNTSNDTSSIYEDACHVAEVLGKIEVMSEGRVGRYGERFVMKLLMQCCEIFV